ncbi:MAG: type IV toxin-antitoxin system AbiEi family antitoxin domain-containing protein [Bacteroidia bacterium]
MKNPAIQKLFKANQGVLTSRELMNQGISHYDIRRLLAKGIIAKVRRGIYTLNDADEHDYKVITKLIPQGIMCMFSAASFYNYSTHIPLRHHLAIYKKRKYTLPEYPPIKLYYWEKAQHELGVEKALVDGVSINIYNREKTVCDFLKFRNRVGADVAKEVVKAYLNDPKRDIVKLKRYSHELKISSIVDQYLTILI